MSFWSKKKKKYQARQSNIDACDEPSPITQTNSKRCRYRSPNHQRRFAFFAMVMLFLPPTMLHLSLHQRHFDFLHIGDALPSSTLATLCLPFALAALCLFLNLPIYTSHFSDISLFFSFFFFFFFIDYY